MGFSQFIDNKYLILTTLLIVPLYTWKSFFNTCKQLKKQHEQKALFQKRHNCVITYQPGKGLSGWPPNVKRNVPILHKESCIDGLYEPFLYFISTAEKSLDIAVMILNIKRIYVELLNARRRGVAIRLLVNYQHSESSQQELKMLKSEGADIQFFISPNSDLSTIMHYKYMVKDKKHLCMGSMNLTASSFLNNYESIVFLSTPYVVENFVKNFEESWEYVKIDNEGLINKTVLYDSNFL